MPAIFYCAVVMFGQTADQVVSVPEPVILQLGPNHRVYRRHIPDAKRNVCSPLVELLTDALIARELEIPPYQQEELMKLRVRYDKLEQLVVAYEARRLAETGLADREAMERDIRATIRDIEDDVAEILLPHQFRRLRQVIFRYSVLAKGAEESLRGDLGAELQLDDAVRQRIRGQWRQLASRLGDACRDEAKTIEQRCLQVLTDQQRKEVAELVGDVSRFCSPSLEIVMRQLSDEVMDPATDGDLVAEYVFYSAGWIVNVSGQLQRDGNFTAGDGYPFLVWMSTEAPAESRYYGDVPLFGVGWSLFNEETGDENQKDIRQLVAAFDKMRAQVVAGDLTREAFLKRVNRLQLEQVTGLIRRFLAYCPAEQRKEIENLLLRRLISLRGLTACLTDGALAQCLATREDQKEVLKRHRLNARERVERLIRDLENCWWENVATNCSASQQVMLQRLIGDPPSALTGMPGLAFYETWEIGLPIPVSDSTQ